MSSRPAPLMIRGLDPDLWHAVRVEAVRRKLTLGALLNLILRDWLDQARSATPSASQDRR